MRMNLLTGIGLVLLLGVSLVGFGNDVVNTELPEAVVEAAESTFKEYNALTSEILDADGNLEFEFETTVSLSFVDEGAGYKNSIGYFTMDTDGSILEQNVVFENFSGTGSGLAGGGDLEPGDTVTIGTFSPGVTLGFFLLANGYTNDNAPMWTTIAALNSDGKDHDAVMTIEELGTLIGFEDIHNLGDRDYNDALMFVTTVVSEPEIDETVVEDAVQQVASAPSAIDLAARGVSSLLGLSNSDAREIVLEYGTIPVNRALEYAADADEFWNSVLGYDVLGAPIAAGGGGSVDGGASGYLISVQLRNPVTGELVTTEHVSLTIVESPSNIIDIVVVPFVEETGSYTFDLRSMDLAPGLYDLYLGFENGTHHLMTMLVPELG